MNPKSFKAAGEIRHSCWQCLVFYNKEFCFSQLAFCFRRKLLYLFLLECIKEVTFPTLLSFVAASWTSPACGFSAVSGLSTTDLSFIFKEHLNSKLCLWTPALYSREDIGTGVKRPTAQLWHWFKASPSYLWASISLNGKWKYTIGFSLDPFSSKCVVCIIGGALATPPVSVLSLQKVKVIRISKILG